MRWMISGLWTVLLVGLLLLLPGCEPDQASAASSVNQPRKITFTLVNRTGGEMKSIGVRGAERPMGYRDIEHGQSGSISHKEPGTPEWLEVNWSDSRGDRHVGKVYVWSQLGQGYGGDLTLVIDRKNRVSLRGD
ncbi:MAG: hypothetical protein AAGC44_05050 [Planctomycetota bacterium]